MRKAESCEGFKLRGAGVQTNPNKSSLNQNYIYIYYVTYLYTYIIYLYICTYIVHSTYIDKFLKSNQPKRNQGGTLKPEKQRLQLDTSWLLKVTSLASGCSIKELWIEPRRASG